MYVTDGKGKILRYLLIMFLLIVTLAIAFAPAQVNKATLIGLVLMLFLGLACIVIAVLIFKYGGRVFA